ncbi:UNVERIFIED_CONTAM: Alkylated DNA repair protein alkB 8 [Gekko kuhli]
MGIVVGFVSSLFSMAASCKELKPITSRASHDIFNMEIDSVRKPNQKLSKTEKKLRQKQVKARNTLLKHEGIECVSSPTKSLVIANGGLGNGVGRCQLLSMVEKCGSVEALLMPPNKPYSFVKYGLIEDCKRAYGILNGKEIMLEDSSQGIVLYVNFVEKVPWEVTAPTALPPGLRVIEDLVSPEEERQLLESIDWSEDEVIPNARKSLKHRRVKHFGYEFRYDNNNVDRDKPLPGGLPELCNVILAKCLTLGYIKEKPDQLTINQYEPGQGIPPHIDTHSAFEDEIISLSLGAESVIWGLLLLLTLALLSGALCLKKCKGLGCCHERLLKTRSNTSRAPVVLAVPQGATQLRPCQRQHLGVPVAFSDVHWG